MVYSILLLISICLTPAFGSNTLESALEKYSPGFINRKMQEMLIQEGLVDKVDSVLSIAERAEGAKPYAVRRAGEIFERDELEIGLYYTPSECGLTLYDKTDIIYFLVNTPPKEVESHVNSLLAQCGKLSNHKNELRCLWIRSDDSINVTLDYFQFLDDLRDEMLTHIKILDDLRNKTLNDSKPVRRHSEPNKRVSFNPFPTSVARQRTRSDQYSFFDSVRRRFSYQQDNNSTK